MSPGLLHLGEQPKWVAELARSRGEHRLHPVSYAPSIEQAQKLLAWSNSRPGLGPPADHSPGILGQRGAGGVLEGSRAPRSQAGGSRCSPRRQALCLRGRCQMGPAGSMVGAGGEGEWGLTLPAGSLQVDSWPWLCVCLLRGPSLPPCWPQGISQVSHPHTPGMTGTACATACSPEHPSPSAAPTARHRSLPPTRLHTPQGQLEPMSIPAPSQGPNVCAARRPARSAACVRISVYACVSRRVRQLRGVLVVLSAPSTVLCAGGRQNLPAMVCASGWIGGGK